MCPFVGVVVGVVGRVQDRKSLGTTWVPTGQKFRQKDKNSAIRQAQKQAVTEFRTPRVQSDRNSALRASGTPEKPKIRNQQHHPLRRLKMHGQNAPKTASLRHCEKIVLLGGT